MTSAAAARLAWEDERGEACALPLLAVSERELSAIRLREIALVPQGAMVVPVYLFLRRAAASEASGRSVPQ